MASHLVQWGESCYFCYDRAEKSWNTSRYSTVYVL